MLQKIYSIQCKSNLILEVDGKRVNYTVSIGAGSSKPEDHSIVELFKRVDLKLYEAKNNGRERVKR